MKYERLRRIFSIFSNTPFHPQWLLRKYQRRWFAELSQYSEGIVLDIGCADQKLRKILSESSTYIGMDFLETSSNLYGNTPEIYGDAQQIPFLNNSVNTVFLLEVLEHLPAPGQCFQEIYRVLKPDGIFVITVPFLYPIHDAPYDFQRFTIYGLRALANKNNFHIEREESKGHSILAIAVLTNLALVRTTLEGFRCKNLSLLLIVFLPVLIPLLNIVGWVFSMYRTKGSFMTLGYFLVLKRNKGNNCTK